MQRSGASFDSQIESGDLTPRQAWNKSWDVNVTGAQIVTSTFAPLLLQSSQGRLLFIASGTSTLAGQVAEALPMDKPPPQRLAQDAA